MNMKICKGTGKYTGYKCVVTDQPQPLNNFGKNSKSPDGKRATCKKCRSAENKVSNERNGKKHMLSVSEGGRREEIYATRLALRAKHPEKQLAVTMRSHVKRYLRNGKNKRTAKIVGCSWEFLRKEIENQFYWDMTWDNHGTYWHLDHIVALAHAETDEDVYNRNHWTNLQPLTVEHNLEKAAKTEWFHPIKKVWQGK